MHSIAFFIKSSFLIIISGKLTVRDFSLKLPAFKFIDCFRAHLFIGLLLSLFVTAQETSLPKEFWQEHGIPTIENYGARDYGAGNQNWVIVQDERGVMYFGNNMGVLIWDGQSWSLIRIKGERIVWSLAYLNGRVYVGSIGELGYLVPDASGQLTYVSLMEEIPEQNWDFSNVRDAFVVNNSVVFRTNKYLFIWADGEMRIWQPATSFGKAFRVDDTIYIREKNAGLMRMAGDSLQLIPGSEIFATKSITVMNRIDENQIIIGTRHRGLYRYDGNRFYPFASDINEFLKSNKLYAGANLSDDLIILGTLRAGAVVIDKNGRFCQLLNKANGLQDDEVYYIYPDNQKGVWFTFGKGLARAEMPSSLTYYDKRLGIESQATAIVRHQGRLYATTNRGVFTLQTRKNLPPVFEPIPGIAVHTWALLSTGDHLIAAALNGIYHIYESGAVKVKGADLENISPRLLYRSRQDASWIFVGGERGLAALRFRDNQWQAVERFRDLTFPVYGIAEDDDGAVWMGSRVDGVIKLNIDFQASNALDASPGMEITRFDEAHGLPSSVIMPFRVAGRVFFTSYKGLRSFDADRQLFLPDTTFGQMLADSLCRITLIAVDHRNNIWVRGNHANKSLVGRALLQPDGSYNWEENPFIRLKRLGNLIAVYPEENGVVWFGGAEGVSRYTSHFGKDYSDEYNALVRRMVVNGDSLIYGGTPPDDNIAGNSAVPELAFANNTLRFEFSATSYDDVSANHFQYQLKGFDKKWSGWTKEAKKDYTALSAGDYTFRVRAKNIYGQLSSEDAFNFTILPPWHLSWWAYLLYGILGVAFIALVVKYRVRHLERKTRELEAIVSERTVKIRKQAEKLQELDQLKSQFFANISHEFRTPLTLILGPLEDVLAKIPDATTRDELRIMERNANRLMGLINQLLDLSRLESGKMELKASRGDLLAFLKGIVMSFASLAHRKNIDLQFDSVENQEGLLANAYFDPDKMEKVFANLLSNAFKFTPDGGKISVQLSVNSDQSRDKKLITDNCLLITIKDSGIGIPANRLPHIFDRFYQVDSSATRAYEGSGIGLALTKELIALHHGEIKAESKEGKGTVFTIRLPLGNSHLDSDQIANDSNAELGMRNAELEESSQIDIPHSTFDIPNSLKEQSEIPEEVDLNRKSEFRIPNSEFQNSEIILIVDDYPDVRRYIRRTLEKDFQIIEAEDGKAGVAAAVENIPDLIISDVMMPEMDGYQLCETLKTNEKTSHVPVILLTARAGEEDKLAGLETGADDYLTKPFNSKELRTRVNNLIELRRNLRERYRKEGILQPKEIAVTSVEEQFLQKLVAIVEENLAEEDFNVEKLSSDLAMSRRQLLRKIRALTGQTPTDFVRSFRLKRAKQMMEKGAGTISEIAYAVGFNNLAYFSRSFRKEYGKPPSEFVSKKT